MAIASGTALLIVAAASAAGATYTAREQHMVSKKMDTIQGQQADAQAKQIDLQAQAERTQAEVDELDRQRTLDRIISAQNAVFGASGLATTSGSFANIQTVDTGRAAEATRLNQLFTDTRQVGFQAVSTGIRTRATISRAAAKYRRRANTLRNVTDILKLGASTYSG